METDTETNIKPPLAAVTCYPTLADILENMESGAASYEKQAKRCEDGGNIDAAIIARGASHRLRGLVFAIRQCLDNDQAHGTAGGGDQSQTH